MNNTTNFSFLVTHIIGISKQDPVVNESLELQFANIFLFANLNEK